MSGLVEDKPDTRYYIQSYRPGVVRISQQDHTHNLMISPDELWPLPIANLSDLTEAVLQPIIECRPECVIFGSGERLVFPPARVFAPLIQAHIGYEVMDTGAACRTLVALFSEGRKVLGALIL